MDPDIICEANFLVFSFLCGGCFFQLVFDHFPTIILTVDFSIKGMHPNIISNGHLLDIFIRFGFFQFFISARLKGKSSMTHFCLFLSHYHGF
mmetsp:Transcript_107566/g.310863  ORF Transcript_107566/g.310863 Transcript_107566/m.310863 type:complete len:92 (+) Transcript_107566:1479-1754(+)